MIVGIVGNEAAKFTTEGAKKARDLIRSILTEPGVTEVVSGGCHLGGIDIWTEDVGEELGLKITVFLPTRLSWEVGYKPRNLKIVNRSDVVPCITVNRLPEYYTGMNVKSGGCWTMLHAKKGVLHIIEQ
jgi:hypothetical protein